MLHPLKVLDINDIKLNKIGYNVITQMGIYKHATIFNIVISYKLINCNILAVQ